MADCETSGAASAGGGPASILPADLSHLDELMQVMRASFDPRFGEAWSALQLAGTIGQDNTFVLRALVDGTVAGFCLCRLAGPEVELLLIAVAPNRQRTGLAQALISAAQQLSLSRGATEMFLEVRENNLSARQLYRHTGFHEAGRRSDYYTGADGSRFAAITMRRALLFNN